LRGIIERFETEYPETRLPSTLPTVDTGDASDALSHTTSASSATVLAESQVSNMPPSLTASTSLLSDAATAADLGSDSDSDHGDKPMHEQRRMSKRNSDVSLAAKAQAAEEGKVLRIGQTLRHDHHDEEGEEEHVRVLREKLKALKSGQPHEDIHELGISAQ